MSNLDGRARDVVASAMRACEADFELLHKQVAVTFEGFMDSCYAKSLNVDKFSECLVGKERTIEDTMKMSDVKIHYFTKNADQCLKENKTVAECTQQVVLALKDTIGATKRHIQTL